MVSFSCESCNDTIIKKKVTVHLRKCRGASFTCLDCSTTFTGLEFQQHTSCITEDEKYQKSLYRGKKGGNNSNISSITSQEVVQTSAIKKHQNEKSASSKVKEGPSKISKKESSSELRSEWQMLVPENKSISLRKLIKSLANSHDNSKKEMLAKLRVSRKSGTGEIVIKLSDQELMLPV